MLIAFISLLGERKLVRLDIGSTTRMNGETMFRSRKARRGAGIPFWDWIQLDVGKTWQGWVAGPHVGIEGHWSDSKPKGTKACRSELTGGALKCPYCHDRFPPVWKAYVPLWSQAGIRMVAVVGERYAHLLEQLKLHQQVVVSKQRLRGAPIMVEPMQWGVGRPPLAFGDAKPQDLKPWLLRVWGDEELERWIRDNPVSDELPETKAGKVSLDEQLPVIAAHARGDRVHNARLANDAFIEAARKIQSRSTPSRNGKKGSH